MPSALGIVDAIVQVNRVEHEQVKEHEQVQEDEDEWACYGMRAVGRAWAPSAERKSTMSSHSRSVSFARRRWRCIADSAVARGTEPGSTRVWHEPHLLR